MDLENLLWSLPLFIGIAGLFLLGLVVHLRVMKDLRERTIDHRDVNVRNLLQELHDKHQTPRIMALTALSAALIISGAILTFLHP